MIDEHMLSVAYLIYACTAGLVDLRHELWPDTDHDFDRALLTLWHLHRLLWPTGKRALTRMPCAAVQQGTSLRQLIHLSLNEFVTWSAAGGQPVRC